MRPASEDEAARHLLRRHLEPSRQRHVTNIEKIARTVQIDSSGDGGVQQLRALPQRGRRWATASTGSSAARSGFGLFNNVLSGYRFLASNYEPGDEIYVFGFSRGAYTARSLCGMIGRVGLLTRRALVEEKLPEAVPATSGATRPAGKSGQSDEEFKRDYCHPETPISSSASSTPSARSACPGAMRRRHQFHDVTLSDAVLCARQALAIDEPRMKFEPCLWEAAPRR